jgi:predicted enzyme related to lactoylglutathione lyase
VVEYEIGNGTFGLGCYGQVWKPSSDGTCLALEVENLEQAVAELKAKGVPFAMDIAESPVCQFSIISDPDGNRILIHKRRS